MSVEDKVPVERQALELVTTVFDVQRMASDLGNCIARKDYGKALETALRLERSLALIRNLFADVKDKLYELSVGH